MGAVISHEPRKSHFQGPGLAWGVLWMLAVPRLPCPSKGSASPVGLQSTKVKTTNIYQSNLPKLQVQSKLHFWCEIYSFLDFISEVQTFKWKPEWFYVLSLSFYDNYSMYCHKDFVQASVKANIPDGPPFSLGDMWIWTDCVSNILQSWFIFSFNVYLGHQAKLKCRHEKKSTGLKLWYGEGETL